VHDWLISPGGAEAVLGVLLDVHAPADVHTLIDRYPARCRESLHYREIHTSWLDRIPGAGRWYRHALPLMPAAAESLDLRGYGLVVSDSHAVAKGAITDPSQVHVAYCYTPMRYIWDLRHEYIERSAVARRLPPILREPLMSRIRLWDRIAAQRPSRLVACSHFVARRIHAYYGRSAPVIHPPVPVEEFSGESPCADYYVAVGRPAPNKRLEVLVEAFRRLPERKLVIIGPAEWERRRHALPDNVTVLPRLSRPEYRDYLSGARALVYAGTEDFGIALVEAQAAGTPVIAYAGGASPEIVRPPDGSTAPTGLLFDGTTAAEIAATIEAADTRLARISPNACRENANRFSTRRFKDAWARMVDEVIEERRPRGHARAS